MVTNVTPNFLSSTKTRWEQTGDRETRNVGPLHFFLLCTFRKTDQNFPEIRRVFQLGKCVCIDRNWRKKISFPMHENCQDVSQMGRKLSMKRRTRLDYWC